MRGEGAGRGRSVERIGNDFPFLLLERGSEQVGGGEVCYWPMKLKRGMLFVVEALGSVAEECTRASATRRSVDSEVGKEPGASSIRKPSFIGRLR